MFSFVKKRLKKHKLLKEGKKRTEEQKKLNSSVYDLVKYCGDNLMVYGQPEIFLPKKK